MSSRRVLWTLALVLFMTGPALAAPAKPSKAPPKLAGRVFVTADRVKDVARESLARQFQNAAPQAVLARRQNGHWVGTVVAFFKKPAVQGPIILWIFDKADKQALKDNEPVQAVTVDAKASDTFVHETDFDPDQGYNKDHTYIIRVGQIIAKKEKVYATGEVKLLK